MSLSGVSNERIHRGLFDCLDKPRLDSQRSKSPLNIRLLCLCLQGFKHGSKGEMACQCREM